MSYAETRSKLANLLIKAGYDVVKSLKAVKYPYIESYQLRHNDTFYDSFTKDIIQYQVDRDLGNFDVVADGGFVLINDTEYRILGNKNTVKAHLYIHSGRIGFWNYFYGHGVWWWSYKLRIIAKYRHRYPNNKIVDAYDIVGKGRGGVAEVEDEYGHQEGFVPLPEGGWLEIELPEESS